MMCGPLEAALLAALSAAPYPQYLASLEAHFQIPASLLSKIEHVESRGRVDAVSPVGALGPFQFMSKTAKRFGIDPFNRIQAAHAAAQYLCLNLTQFGDIRLAVAAYNAGEGAVVAYGGKIPPYPETIAYVDSVIGPAPADAVYRRPAQPMVRASVINARPFECTLC